MPTVYPQIYDSVSPTLSREQIERYQEDGFIAFRRLLTPQQVQEACDAWAEIVHRLRELALDGQAIYTPGQDKDSNYAGATIRREGSNVRLLYERNFDPLAASAREAELHVRNLYTYHREHPFFEKLVLSPMIMDTVAQLIDDEVLHFSSMAMAKPPKIGSEKPWHQDDAYFKYAPLEKVVGVWIALDDAAAVNGCMHVLPGLHRRGALKHVHTFDCQIMPDRIADLEPVAVELPAGGAMFFSGMLPHQTPPNHSEQRRRALQYHYRGASTRELEREEYDRTFAEADGTPATCAAAGLN